MFQRSDLLSPERRRVIGFEDLRSADLYIDALYEGGVEKSVKDDPLDPLMGCGNQGGFRAVGPGTAPKLVVLYSSLDHPDWPDFLDVYNGTFTYHGDNKRPGRELHDTPRAGNALLSRCFASLHSGRRKAIPPFFIFTKGIKGRDVVFRGLAVPGAEGEVDDLTALWRSNRGLRFQNYRALFTILNVEHVRRAWIDDLHKGVPETPNAPEPWLRWVESGQYMPLLAEPTIEYRTPGEQLALSANEAAIVSTIYKYFQGDPYAFEPCAAKIAELMDPNIRVTDVTRRYRDGGRDAIGEYLFGPKLDRIAIDFALEAKCKQLNSGVGVKEISRLISRLRHRQFGILVTTSFVAVQAYKEVREDGHPVMIVAAVDIARIMVESGKGTVADVTEWLLREFPSESTTPAGVS
jgi:hypothetical protein